MLAFDVSGNLWIVIPPAVLAAAAVLGWWWTESHTQTLSRLAERVTDGSD